MLGAYEHSELAEQPEVARYCRGAAETEPAVAVHHLLEVRLVLA